MRTDAPLEPLDQLVDKRNQQRIRWSNLAKMPVETEHLHNGKQFGTTTRKDMHMRFTPIVTLLMIAGTPSQAMAQAAPAAVAPAVYSIEGTDIGTLLDDPAAKAVVEKSLPGFSAHPQIDMARGMTLKAVQQYAPDLVTDEALAAIQADFAKLSVKK
jgi:para-nitrobenzyl esterase